MPRINTSRIVSCLIPLCEWSREHQHESLHLYCLATLYLLSQVDDEKMLFCYKYSAVRAAFSHTAPLVCQVPSWVVKEAVNGSFPSPGLTVSRCSCTCIRLVSARSMRTLLRFTAFYVYSRFSPTPHLTGTPAPFPCMLTPPRHWPFQPRSLITRCRFQTSGAVSPSSWLGRLRPATTT